GGSGGGSADRGLWNFGACKGLSCIRRRNGPKGSTGSPKINPPGGVIRAGHFDRRRGSGGGSADRGLWNLGPIGLSRVGRGDPKKSSNISLTIYGALPTTAIWR